MGKWELLTSDQQEFILVTLGEIVDEQENEEFQHTNVGISNMANYILGVLLSNGLSMETRLYALNREETDSCERLTPGCPINHNAEAFDGPCETW